MVNKAILLGFVGKDPEQRNLPNGELVITFSLATSEKYKKDGVMQEQTEWHKVVAYGQLAKIIGEYVKKGSQVYLEGKIFTRKWNANGVDKYSTEIKADTLKLLGGKQEPKSQVVPKDHASKSLGDFEDADLPF
jgi:single-strand DNA-binding protein